jgi:formylmethanofuran dehydrogenase subunit A
MVLVKKLIGAELNFLTHARFKAYASDNEIEWVENEAKNLSDFVFENDENVVELNNE